MAEPIVDSARPADITPLPEVTTEGVTAAAAEGAVEIAAGPTAEQEALFQIDAAANPTRRQFLAGSAGLVSRAPLGAVG